jgi:hypothetical protein
MLPCFALMLALLGAACAPDTWLGGRLRAALIDDPVRVLNGGPLAVLLRFVVLLAVVAFVVGAPEIAALVDVADITAFIELAAAFCLLGAVVAYRAAVHAGRTAIRAALVRRLLPRTLARARSLRARPPRRPSSPSPDDPAPWAVLQPA